MADTKYLSKINKDGDDILLKDSEARESLLYPVDISSLTPSSTFTENSVIGINGVLYRCIADTSDFPVTLQVDGDAFVTNTVNGNIAFVVTDYTLSSDWEVWTDAAIEYWINALDARITTLENANATLQSQVATLETKTADISYNGTTYTAQELLAAMAQLMAETLVTQ